MPADQSASVDVDRLVDDHMRRDPNARQAYYHDALYSAQIRFLRGMLRLADEVMEHEGVPERVRERVVRCVIYGTPDGADAVIRIDEHAARTAAARAGVPLDDVLRGAPEPLRKEPA